MGVIDKYFNDRGYGFIIGDDGKRFFFHVRDTYIPEEQIHIGLKVVFWTKEYVRPDGTKTIKAVNVRMP